MGIKQNALKDTKTVVFILLAGLLLFLLTANIVLLAQNHLPEGKDSYAHVTAFLDFKHIAEQGEWGRLYAFGDYPPFFYFSAFLLDRILGGVLTWSALYAGSLFLLILIFSVYGIGRRLDDRTGILGAFICGMYPLVFLCSRHFSLELPLAAMVALSVWLLLKTEMFTQTLYSMFFGLSCAAGMLTKQTFIIYLGGPLIVTLLFAFRQRDPLMRLNSGKNLLISMLAAFLPAMPFYVNRQVYIQAWERAGFSGAVSAASGLDLKHLFFYARGFLTGMGGFFLAAFLTALVRIKKIPAYLRYVFISWLIVPLFILTAVVLKYAEYLTACLPACALLTSAAVFTLNAKQLKKIIVAVFLFAGLGGFFYDSFISGALFFRTYYPVGPQVRDMRIFSPELGENFYSLTKKIGNSRGITGICSEGLKSFFPSFFLRNVFAYSRKNALITDYTYRTTAFYRESSGFRYLIFVSSDDKDWPDEEVLKTLAEENNRDNFTKIEISAGQVLMRKDEASGRITIPENELSRLSEMRPDFRKAACFDFLPAADLPVEKVFVYERKK